jgi:hypothetical protein
MFVATIAEGDYVRELVAEAGGDSDLVAALGAAAVEDGCTGLGGHAYEESVDLATAAAVRLKGALGHRRYPVLMIFVGKMIWWLRGWSGEEWGRSFDGGLRFGSKASRAASLEYIRAEENWQCDTCGNRETSAMAGNVWHA